MSDELEQQIERERLAIVNAPAVPVAQLRPQETGNSGRCGTCGQPSNNLIAVHDRGPKGKIINTRYKGAECCGGRHL